MVDIVVDPEALSKSKVHPIIIARACKKMLEHPDPTRTKKAKKRWQEIVWLEEGGLRLAMNCHMEDNKIVITGIRQLTKHKPVGPPRRRI